MAYHTNVGPISGPLHNKHRNIAIGVFQAREIRSPIGLAMADGQGQDGLILWRDGDTTIDVLRHPDDPAPIRTARLAGRTASGIAIWEMIVGHTELPGRWIVLGREFIPRS